MKVFLSRNQPSDALNQQAVESGWGLTFFSCIQKSLTTSVGPPKADWIFFYSPGAVRLYAENFEPSTHRLAALGEGTAQEMREQGLIPDFIGSSANPSEVVKEFTEVLGADQIVVQARGEKSFERLREVLRSEQVLDWPFYRSEPKESFPIAEADYYIFTSPSNAEAYLEKYELSKGAKVLVFGESTKKTVEQYSTAKVLKTDHPGEEMAIEILKSL